MSQTPPEPAKAVHPAAKLAIEAGPLVVFFVTNSVFDTGSGDGIFKATAAFMIAITISLFASWKLERRLPPVALITTVFVLVFGGLTLVLADDMFIKLKPTIVNCLFAAILGFGLATGRLFLKVVFGSAFQLTDAGWRALTVRWILFCIALALLNEYVWRSYSTNTWVAFKSFGIMPLTVVFSLTLVPLINKHQPPEERPEAPTEDS